MFLNFTLIFSQKVIFINNKVESLISELPHSLSYKSERCQNLHRQDKFLVIINTKHSFKYSTKAGFFHFRRLIYCVSGKLSLKCQNGVRNMEC